MLHVSVSAYKQAEAERKSDPICRKVGGGRDLYASRKGEYQWSSTRSPCVMMVMFWKYFGAIVLKLALLKSPVTTNAASGYAVSCSLIFPYSSLSAWSVLARGGM